MICTRHPEGEDPRALTDKNLIRNNDLPTAVDLGLQDEAIRIKSGRRYTFKHDSSPFKNDNFDLPNNTNYTEYIVARPFMHSAGIERIYVGKKLSLNLDRYVYFLLRRRIHAFYCKSS